MKKMLSVTLLLFLLFTYFPVQVIAFEENPFSEFDLLWEKIALGEERALPTPSLENELTYIVNFKQTASLNEIYHCVNTSTYALLAKSEMRLFAVEITDLDSFQNKYADILSSIEKDSIQKVDATTNDTLFKSQWAIKALHLDEAWEITTGSSVKVAVIDTGIIRSHEDFVGINIADGYDLVTNTDFVDCDTVGHGTLVSSIICAKRNNNLGIAGVSDLITLVPYRVSDTEDISLSNTTRAVYMAADAGCKVINASYGGIDYSGTENAAIQYAVKKGCIFIASAGNERSTLKTYPACYNNVISVGATDFNNSLAWFSNRNGVDCVAPGFSVYVADTANNSSYASINGTSFSAPYVAGIAVLALSVNANISPIEFASLIRTSSTDIGNIGYDKSTGWGIVNAKLLVEQAAKLDNDDAKITIENGYVYGLTDQMTLESLKTHYGENVFVSIIGTGKTLIIDDNCYIIILKGDLNGDGKIDSIDYFIMKRAVLATYTLSKIQRKAACLEETTIPTATDYLKIKRHFLGTYQLFDET